MMMEEEKKKEKKKNMIIDHERSAFLLEISVEQQPLAKSHLEHTTYKQTILKDDINNYTIIFM